MAFVANEWPTLVGLFTDPFVDIDIRSEGCNDPNKKPDTCGIAYIKVDGKDHSLHRRGHNVVTVDLKTGKNHYIKTEKELG